MAGFAILCLIIYKSFIPTISGSAGNLDIHSGSYKTIQIGAKKDEILSNPSGQNSIVSIKSKECTKTWIDVKKILPAQRECLIESDVWQASLDSNNNCQTGAIRIISLHFKNDDLSMINVKCTDTKL